MKHRTVFTFVREPLGRFISGYAEIDRIYLGPRYELLWDDDGEDGELSTYIILYLGYITEMYKYISELSIWDI